MSFRSRAFTATLNNYNDIEYNNIYQFAQVHSLHYIIGKEVGKLGTPHLQIYIYMKNPISISAFKRYTSDRIHVEVSKGTHLQNYIYCSKDGNFVSNMNIEMFEKKKKPTRSKEEIYNEAMNRIKNNDNCICDRPDKWEKYEKKLVDWHNGISIDKPRYDCDLCNLHVDFTAKRI